MDRGDRQERIFLGGVDRQDWLETLAEPCQKTGWPVHASCLMSNHFHRKQVSVSDSAQSSNLAPLEGDIFFD
jgi:hypothetical protein